MLAKIRHYVSESTLLNIYHGIFSSLLTYGSQVWGQSINKHISRLQRIQNRAIRIINFANFREPSSPLYNKSKILKFSDHINLQNFFFVHDSLKGSLPLALKDSFQLAQDTYSYNTRGASQFKMVLPKARTQVYGIKSIKYQSAAFWNMIISLLPREELHLQGKSICKKIITKYFLDSYISQT